MLIYLDIETHSDLDVRDVGSYVYGAHPSTEVLCMAWAVNNRPIQVEKTPEGIASLCYWLISQPDATLVAHNVDFERNVLKLRDVQWLDTAALAARMSLPRSLEDLAKALFPDRPEYHKDMAGNRTMLKLCKRNRKGEWWTPETAPADFEKLYAYCAKDVEVMRACHRQLLELSPQEQAIWELTQAMNERGVRIDVDSLPAAQAYLERHTSALRARFVELTGLNPRSPVKVAAHFGLPSADKMATRAALRDPAMAKHHEALRLLQQLNASSVSKVDALANRVSEDGRLRGAFMYCGAERTGRWSSVGVQLQNLLRGLGKETDLAFRALLADALELLFDGGPQDTPMPPLSPLSIMGGMLRGFLTGDGSDGELLVGDFAQIEARDLASLAGQEDLLEVFEQKGDPYSRMASRIYGREITKADKAERFMGKQTVLGCLAEDTEVLTRRGWARIVDVGSADMVWDGVEWVHHGGVICQGIRETIRCLGIGATPDHSFETGGSWSDFESLGAPENSHLRASALASASSAWRATSSEVGEGCVPSLCLAPATGPTSTEWTRTTYERAVRLGAIAARSAPQATPGKAIGGMPTFSPTTRTGDGCSTESRPASKDASIPERPATSTTGAGGYACSQSGCGTAKPSCDTCSRCPDGTNPDSKSTGSTSTEAMSPAISGSSPAERTPVTAGRSPDFRMKSRVFDISLAGPRNRFTVMTDEGPMLAHNCGYGMGHRRFREMLDEIYDVQIDVAFAKKVIQTYRTANPAIVNLWKTLQGGFRAVIGGGMQRVKVGPVFMGTARIEDHAWAWIEIRSGRRLWYFHPYVKGGEVRYFGREPGRGWGDVHTHGGKIAENIVQAECRDIMAEAMLRLDAAGFKVCGTIHDEVICPGMPKDLPEFERHLKARPAWAPKLPIDVEVFCSRRYRK